MVTIAATDNETNYKMVGTDLFRFALYKTTTFANSCNDRFIKELSEVFFTLLSNVQFVDIVKCV